MGSRDRTGKHVNKTMPRKNLPHTYKNTGEWKAAFLDHLRVLPNILKAAQAVGIERRMVYKARAADPEFAAAIEAAYREGAENIQDIAFEKALSGDPRWQATMIFLLKCWMAERYRDTVHSEISGPGGNALTINVVYENTGLTDTDTTAE